VTAVVLRGDARALPLPDACVDLIVTSPPYFGLRSYTDDGAHYDGQIGSEASPREWLAALAECTAEWVRVLKPSGSIFVNLGDKFSQRVATRPSSHQDGLFPDRPELRKDWKRDRAAGLARMPYENVIDGDGNYVREKSLIGLPWRYALACMDDLGLILRRDIIWSKPNGLPESVTDRCRSSHEYLFHFTRQPRYYAAVDEIREQYAPGTAERYRSGYQQTLVSSSGQTKNAVLRCDGGGPKDVNPLGKLPGSVWDIPSQPLTVPAALGVDHFAAFPMELPRRCVLGWSPPGICTACGEGRRPVVDALRTVDGMPTSGTWDTQANGHSLGPQGVGHWRYATTRRHMGYACACPQPDAPTRPSLVVDPFGGTGTVAAVAAAYGRTGISVDMSGDYSRLARWRTTDPAERARAMLVAKPPPVPDGQGSLFDDAEAS